jgi:hypothetical protein
MKKLLQCVLMLAFVLPCVSRAQFLTLGGNGVQGGVGGGGGTPLTTTTISSTNVDDTLTYGNVAGDWKAICYNPGCAPGGSGVPTAVSQTINNTTQQKDGDSMYISVSANSTTLYTNALMVSVSGNCDTCTRVVDDFWIYVPSTASYVNARELDDWIFDKTNNYKNMWGMQCNNGGYWQIDSDFGWSDTSLACSLSVGWHHIQRYDHRIIGETGGHAGYGYNYYDGIAIDGAYTDWSGGCGTSSGSVNYNAGHCSTPAEEYPSSYTQSISGFQFQLDAGPNSSAVTVDEYIDEANFYGGN